MIVPLKQPGINGASQFLTITNDNKEKRESSENSRIHLNRSLNTYTDAQAPDLPDVEKVNKPTHGPNIY